MPSIKVGVEDTRNKILSLLGVKDMSISQLAEALDKDQSTVYRHLKKLEKTGYVQVTGERKKYHIPEKMYGRTANIFLLSMTGDGPQSEKLGKEWHREQSKNVLELLNLMEICDENTVDESLDDLTELFTELDTITDNMIEENQDKIGEISYPTLARLKLILFLTIIDRHEELKKKTEKLLEKFHLL